MAVKCGASFPAPADAPAAPPGVADDLRAAALAIRDLNAALAHSRRRIDGIHDVLDEAWGRILTLEAGNPEWIERREAEERRRRQELREARERLRNAPAGPTPSELFGIGRPRPGRLEPGHDEAPVPDGAALSP